MSKTALCSLLTVALMVVVVAKPSHRCQEKKAKDDAVFAVIMMNMSEYDCNSVSPCENSVSFHLSYFLHTLLLHCFVLLLTDYLHLIFPCCITLPVHNIPSVSASPYR